ncbi:glutamate--cysteine ligase [Weissella viridescens]|uniref:Glutamate--cysteine ligase n=1 Tax=Weissella viridescens TaxID=1629 RepID=A0A3P2RA14_WEIVI|nr:glutamate--cysteine ligase [Weissella viridescens]RRG17617.1 glutamate--cysteine ligase [Weissella viridescens]
MAQQIPHLPQSLTFASLADHVGIEIEEHRVQLPSAHLSQHPHDSALGDRRTEPNFQTDFSESQEELVTDPQPSVNAALDQLKQLQTRLTAHLKTDEIIWPLSMPPYMADSDVTYLANHFERPWYADYRKILIERYGYYQHIMTGIHVNFSLSDTVSAPLLDSGAYPDRNALYFQILKQVSKYRWLITYLFGASPITENPIDDRMLERRSDIKQPVRSWRSSSAGFANHRSIQLDFTNLDNFLASLDDRIDAGDLYDLSEYYGPVRVKATDAYHSQHRHSVQYLEFRIFDLNPFTPLGIDQNALTVLELLILDALYFPETLDNATMQKSIEINDAIALQHPDTPLPDAQQAELRQLLEHFKLLQAQAADGAEWQTTIDDLENNVVHPQDTISQQLLPHIHDESLQAFAVQQGKHWKTMIQDHHN